MCVGENCAPQAAQYVNAQLTVLHANAASCFKEHGNAQRSEDHFRYGHALYDFAYGKVAKRRQTKPGYDTLFHATFDKPEIEFICNHDAILRIKTTCGHYYAEPFNHSISSKSPVSDRVKELQSQVFEFRISYDVRCASSTDLQIGGAPAVVRLITFDFHGASFLSATPTIEHDPAEIIQYLHHYLKFLQNAGNHILYSLPNFEISRLPMLIDFMASGHAALTGDSCSELYGVHVDKINEQLKLTWTKAAIATAIGASTATDWKANSIAEYQVTSTLYQSDVRYHLKFGPPTVEAICSREAFLFLRLDKVLVFEEADLEGTPTGAFEGWNIPVTVEVFQEQTSETRLRINMNKIKVGRQLSEEHRTDDYATYRIGVLDFVEREYMAVLESAGYLILHDTGRAASVSSVQLAMQRIGTTAITESFEESAETTEASWSDVISGSDLQGFDQLNAVSQGSINLRFCQMHEAARSSQSWMSILAKWSYEEYFSTTFEPLTVYLLSNNRALLWVHLSEGYLRPLVDMQPSTGVEPYDFEDIRLAFEVKLDMLDDLAIRATSTEWYSNASASPMYKLHANQADRILRYLCLDTSGAEFLYEYSQIDDLLQTTGSELIDKLQGIIYYLRQHYFPALVTNGLHILYTTPLWSAPPAAPSYALTDVTFQVYSRVEVTRYNWTQLTASTEPVLVILGMTCNRPRPNHCLSYSTDWVARVHSHGTVAISNKDQNVLHLLARINSLTSVIPVLVPADETDGSKVQLTTIAARYGGRLCMWKPERIQESSCIKHEWEYIVSTAHSHAGSSITNGAYSVTCATKNYVELPTVFRSGKLEIKVWGEVTVNITYKAGSIEGTARGVAKWLASINIRTDRYNGVKCDALDAVPIVCENVEYRGNAPASNFLDIQNELKTQLPQSLDFKEVVQGIRHYEGAWQACYPGINAYVLASPVFNHHGDLLFELRPHGQWNAAPVPSSRNKPTVEIPKDTNSEHGEDTGIQAEGSEKSGGDSGIASSSEEGGLET